MAGDMLKGKNTKRISTTITQRYREPSNKQTASNMTQFVFDYKKFRNVIPDNNPKALIEATQGREHTRTAINRDGGSAALGKLRNADLGGSPDEPGRF